jgi:glycolate oxidase iron-sulfur subunit
LVRVRDPRERIPGLRGETVLREYTRDCVHCGFCLPTCPTYVLWHEEMDSPRGRIQLMEARLDGTVALNRTVVEHFDRCLGCMACLSSCPSGVRYDRLIESTRAAVESEHERTASERLVRSLLFAVLPHPRRLRAALRLAPLGRLAPLPRRFRPLVELAPPWRSSESPPALTSPNGRPRGRVGVLTGCVQSVVFGDVNAATARVLAADGYEVVVPPQGCCGALSVHAGRLEEGRRLARRLVDAFADVDLVAVNASGCGSHLKELGWLLGDERAASFSAKVRDVGELLHDTVPRAPRHPLPLRVAVQDSCHLRHAQRLPLASRSSLARIPGLEIVEPAEQDLCCGSAGIYNVVQPGAARDLGDRKAGHVLATGAQAYASANPGCLVQVSTALRRARRPLPALHPIELVDASIRNVGATALARGARR